LPLRAQSKGKGSYKKYSQIQTSSQLTGADLARKILNDTGLFDVSIEQTEGVLSDHYDPREKVVRLSPDIYNGRSMASSAVAAQEVGHAIQDAEEYAFLNLRTDLVHVANLGSNKSFILILSGFLLVLVNIILIVIIFI